LLAEIQIVLVKLPDKQIDILIAVTGTGLYLQNNDPYTLFPGIASSITGKKEIAKTLHCKRFGYNFLSVFSSSN
jgi:hypothetical protein